MLQPYTLSTPMVLCFTNKPNFENFSVMVNLKNQWGHMQIYNAFPIWLAEESSVWVTQIQSKALVFLLQSSNCFAEAIMWVTGARRGG